jgi:hypothetical protein
LTGTLSCPICTFPQKPRRTSTISGFTSLRRYFASTVVPDDAKWYVGVTMKTMRRPSRFHVVVDAADRLTAEEQETLVTVLNRRLADRRRAELVRDIREGQKEFERGALRPSTPEKIVKEILS